MGLNKLRVPKIGEAFNNGVKAAYNPVGATKDAVALHKKPKKESAAEAAARIEAERQAGITSTTRRINELYDSPERASQQNQFFESMKKLLTGDVNRQHEDAQRNLKFANARGGLTGGSAAADNQTVLGKEYSRALLDATRKAQGALADVKSADASSRANLIQLAQAGLDTGSAATQAAEAMQVSLGNASKAAMGGIPDAFKTTSDIWKRSQEAAEKRRGMTTPVGSLYGSEWS